MRTHKHTAILSPEAFEDNRRALLEDYFDTYIGQQVAEENRQAALVIRQDTEALEAAGFGVEDAKWLAGIGASVDTIPMALLGYSTDKAAQSTTTEKA